MRTPRVFVALVLALPSVLLLGCADSKIAGGKADGPAIYRDACARCHGPEGIPTRGMAARTGVKSLQTLHVLNELSDQDIRHQILKGSASKTMPSFQGALSDAQLDAVVAHVKTLAAKAKETP